MAITVVQSVGTNGTGGGAAGTWTSTFSGGVTAGNTLFLVVYSYSTSTATIGSGSPVYNGSSYPGAVQLFSLLSPGGNNVYVSAWMFPAIGSGGGTTVGATCTGGGNVDGNVGSVAYEVSGLGAAPSADRLATHAQVGSGATTSSGATPAIRFAPEFILGGSVGFGVNQTAASGFTNLWNNGGTGFCEGGYQIATSSGGTFTWSTNADGGADSSAGIVTVAPAQVASAVVAPAAPGRTWVRRFRHRQLLLPPPPSSPAVTVTAVLATGAGTAQGAAPAIGVNAAPATASAAAKPPVFARYITGLGGTGAGYFADQTATPRMVLGDAAWALPGNAGRWNSGNWQADFDTYLANRAGQGFTVIYAKPIGTTQSGNIDDGGSTFDSLYPFQGGTPSTGVTGANPSSGLTSAFWARIDYFLNSALGKGITVFLNAIGYASDFEGGPGPLAGKSSTEFQAYGAALGARYASQPNLVWHLADDYFGGDDTKISAFMTGVRGAGDTHAVSIENMPESDSRNTFDTSPSSLAWGTSNAQYNFCYSYNVTYFGVERAYAESSPIPVIQGDGYFYAGSSSYAGGSGAFAFDRAIRQDAWHAISSGARGIIHGAQDIWEWPSGALASSATDWYYANNAGNIRTLMESLTDWQKLVPDASSALVTAGRGTHASAFTSGGGGGQYEVAFTDSYVTASRTPDGGSGSSLAVIYLSHGTTITVDQTKMVSGYQAYWADPVTGTKTLTTSASTYNSAAQGNNSQGDPDWVLILQASTGASVNAVLATGTGTAQGPVAAVGVNAALASGAGTAKSPAPAIGASAALASGTGTAQGPVPAIAVNAVLASAAATAQNATASTSASGTANAVLATGTGTAQSAVAAIGVNAAVATGAGAALNATVQTSGSANVTAGLATGAGTAQNPAPAIAVNAAAATGAGTAQGIGRAATAGLATGAGTAQAPAAVLAAQAQAQAAHALAAALNAAIPAQHVPAASAPSVTDPRDGTSSVTARFTSAPSVSPG